MHSYINNYSYNCTIIATIIKLHLIITITAVQGASKQEKLYGVSSGDGRLRLKQEEYTAIKIWICMYQNVIANALTLVYTVTTQ